MVRLNLPPLPKPDAADLRVLAMLLVGMLLITVAVLWSAWLLGVAVALYHLMAGG